MKQKRSPGLRLLSCQLPVTVRSLQAPKENFPADGELMFRYGDWEKKSAAVYEELHVLQALT